MTVSEFRAPMNHPPTLADLIAAKSAEMTQALDAAAAVSTSRVKGPRDQLLSVAEAVERAKAFREAVETEEAEGSERHRRVSRWERFSVLLVLIVIDFPIMLWLTATVLNVDWSSL
jgi:uncharacterized protein YaiL (DUF2058 family)